MCLFRKQSHRMAAAKHLHCGCADGSRPKDGLQVYDNLICPNIQLLKRRSWTPNRVALTDPRKSLASSKFYLSSLRISPSSVPTWKHPQSLQKTTKVLEQLAIVKTVTLKKAKNREMLRCADISSHDTPFNLLYLFQVYNQISLIPEGAARRDALRLTKKKAKSLPRVTAYATAG